MNLQERSRIPCKQKSLIALNHFNCCRHQKPTPAVEDDDDDIERVEGSELPPISELQSESIQDRSELILAEHEKLAKSEAK